MNGTKISHNQILYNQSEGGLSVGNKTHGKKLECDVALKFLPHNLCLNKADPTCIIQEAKSWATLNYKSIFIINVIEENDGK